MTQKSDTIDNKFIGVISEIYKRKKLFSIFFAIGVILPSLNWFFTEKEFESKALFRIASYSSSCYKEVSYVFPTEDIKGQLRFLFQEKYGKSKLLHSVKSASMGKSPGFIEIIARQNSEIGSKNAIRVVFDYFRELNESSLENHRKLGSSTNSDQENPNYLNIQNEDNPLLIYLLSKGLKEKRGQECTMFNFMPPQIVGEVSTYEVKNTQKFIVIFFLSIFLFSIFGVSTILIIAFLKNNTEKIIN